MSHTRPPRQILLSRRTNARDRLQVVRPSSPHGTSLPMRLMRNGRDGSTPTWQTWLAETAPALVRAVLSLR